MKTLQKILPTTSGTGGTRVGSTFLDDWYCPYYWYANHLAPFHGGTGSQELYTAEPLWLGGVLHDALEAYFRSGWKDGQFSYDAGLDALTTSSQTRSSELAYEDQQAELRSQAERIFRRYALWAGPEGPPGDRDWEQWRVLDLGGEPLIEREFEIDLEWEGYYYTSKPDAVVWRLSDGFLCALDHKTVSASGVGISLRSMRKRPQLTAEQLALSLVWPDENVGLMVNAIIKNAAATKPPRRLEDADRNQARLGLFRLHTIRKLQQIERHAEEYWDLLSKGVPEPQAARMVFDDEPTDQSCIRYNRTCPLLDICIPGDDVVEWRAHEVKARYQKKDPTHG